MLRLPRSEREIPRAGWCAGCLVCLFVVASLSPAHAQVAPPVFTVSISVRVYDSSNETPLDRVRLDLLRFPDGILAIGFTDSSGRYTFTNITATVSEFIVRGERAGYQKAEVTVFVRRGSTVLDASVPMSPVPGEQASPGGAISAHLLSVPQAARAAYEKGRELLQEKKDPARSLEHFRRAIQLSPRFHEAYFLLGMAQAKLNAHEEARAAFLRALELNPQFVEPHFTLAVLLAREKDYDEAERLLRRGMELDPNGWRWPFQLARLFAERDRWDLALEFGARAHERPDAPPRVHLLMADLYSAVGQKEKAIAELEKFRKLDPNSPYMPRVQQALADLRKTAMKPE